MAFGDKLRKLFGKKDENKLKSNDNHPKNENVQNFRYLDDLIHSGQKEIYLNFDIILDDDEEMDYYRGIELDVDDIVIDGNDNVIDAKEKTRIFNITAKNVTIRNITFKRGFTTEKAGLEKGGAIYNQGTLRIHDSDFSDNTATLHGGAIYNEGELIVDNVSFSHNKSVRIGGALYNSGNVRILNSAFLDNDAVSGAAVFSDKGNVKIINSTFSANNCGAIFSREYLEIFDSTFRDNESFNDGAIKSSGFSIIVNSNLLNNHARSVGGAAINEGEMIMQNVTFEKNHAEYDMSHDIENKGKLLMNDTIIKNNSVTIVNKGTICTNDPIRENINKGPIEEIKCPENNQKDFTYLNQLINEGLDEISLENDIVFNIANDIPHIFGIDIDIDGIAINGNGHTIDGSNISRIFNVKSKGIKLKNIVLKNAKSKNGGAIYNTGELTITDSALTDNLCEESDGGAIYNDGKLTITNSNLSNNTAQGSGGALFNHGDLTILHCELSGNIVKETGTLEKRMGCAIYNDKGKVHIKESTFKDNIGVTLTSSSIGNFAHMNIIKSTFLNNGKVFNTSNLNIDDSIIKMHPWGIMENEGDLTIKNSKIFGNNQAWMSGMITNRKLVKLINCQIFENKGEDLIIQNEAYMEIYDSEFTSNQTKILIDNLDEGTLSIYGGEFIGNCVESVIRNSGRYCSISRTTFKNITSDDSFEDFEGDSDEKVYNIYNNSELTFIKPEINDEGHSIFNNGHILIKEPSKDLEGKIEGPGKITMPNNEISSEKRFDFAYLDRIIRQSETNEITLKENICFGSYEKDFYEGGIELDIDNLIIDGKGKTIDANNNSRIFIVSGKNITLKNIKFKNGHIQKNYNNPLNNYGGAIRTVHNSSLTITNCEFIDNLCDESGGAIHNNGNLGIIDSKLSNNKSETGTGGAIINEKGDLIIEGSILSNNSSEEDGGAIYNKSHLDISTSTFSANSLKGLYKSGAAIYNGNKLNIRDSLFNDNTAEHGYGGAIKNDDDAKLDITNSRFLNNVLNWGETGGAINNNGEASINSSTFSGNITRHGGGAIENWGLLVIGESTLSNNSVKSSHCIGGAINNHGVLKIFHSKLMANSAEGEFSRGGAINIQEGIVTIKESCFSECKTSTWGGAIHLEKGELNISDSLFSNNSSEFSGAIENRAGILKIFKTRFYRNCAINKSLEYGGAIQNRGFLDLIECDFKDNNPNDVRNIQKSHF